MIDNSIISDHRLDWSASSLSVNRARLIAKRYISARHHEPFQSRKDMTSSFSQTEGAKNSSSSFVKINCRTPTGMNTFARFCAKSQRRREWRTRTILANIRILPVNFAEKSWLLLLVWSASCSRFAENFHEADRCFAALRIERSAPWKRVGTPPRSILQPSFVEKLGEKRGDAARCSDRKLRNFPP